MEILHNQELVTKSDDLHYLAGALAAIYSLHNEGIIQGRIASNADPDEVSSFRRISDCANLPFDDMVRIARKKLFPGETGVWVKHRESYHLYVFFDRVFMRGFANMCEKYGERYYDFIIASAITPDEVFFILPSQQAVLSSRSIVSTPSVGVPKPQTEPEPTNDKIPDDYFFR